MILTINTKEPKTRVVFPQPLPSISEIQLVDYDFPETYERFETNQVIKSISDSKTLLTIPSSGYNYKILRTMIIMSNLGIIIHQTNEGYCISSKNKDAIITKELAKVLDVPRFLIAEKFYPISWPKYKYYIYCDIGTTTSVLGQMTTDGNKLVPTNLVAIIPSKSGFYPRIPIQVEREPINYLTLSVLDESGNVPKFSGVSFRINLRVTH